MPLPATYGHGWGSRDRRHASVVVGGTSASSYAQSRALGPCRLTSLQNFKNRSTRAPQWGMTDMACGGATQERLAEVAAKNQETRAHIEAIAAQKAR
jgi:hypothetical protein